MRGPVPEPLKRFIWDIQSMVELAESEREILVIGRDLMARLVANDDWLPEIFALPADAQCQHYLLYGDGLERFCVTSTVLRGTQAVLVRQDGVWEILGLLRGAMNLKHILWEPGAEPSPNGEPRLFSPGAVELMPSVGGEAFELANAASDTVSISIHVYGGETAKIARYPLEADGMALGFASGYANAEDAPAYDIHAIQTEILD